MMEKQPQSDLIKIILDPGQELPSRIDAAKKVGSSGNPVFIAELKKVLARSRSRATATKKWDPAGAERVVDLYVIEALSKLGDESEFYRIGALVEQAGTILQGQDSELYNACIVINSIGRKELIKQLIELTEKDNTQSVKNSVIALNHLDLPHPPVGGSTGPVLSNAGKITFNFKTLKEEMELLADLSKGKIKLSEGVKEFLRTNDYDRGNVKKENVALSEIVERNLGTLGFDYYVESNSIVVCTHKESARRWQEWWKKNRGTLILK